MAPTLGAIIGVGIYKFLFALPEEEEHFQEEVVALDNVSGAQEKWTCWKEIRFDCDKT